MTDHANTPSTFPADFVWGAATAAYQIEGAATADGRGESIWDRFSHTPGKTHNSETGDLACDHYHRYPADVELIKSLNLKAYRFSIAWPRIVPDGGTVVNQAGVDFYSRLVDSVLAAGVTPFVTLYHWDLPQVLEDAGGWLNRETADRFAYYADVMASALGDRVKNWITLNEPWCSAFLGYTLGVHAPGSTLGWTGGFRASHVLYLAHGKAVAAIRSHVKDARIGIAINPSQTEAATDSPEDQAATLRADGQLTRWYLDPLFKGSYPADIMELCKDYLPDIEPGDMETIAAPIDFLGVNNYTRLVVTDSESDNQPLNFKSTIIHDAEYTSMAWEIAPDSFYRLLTRIGRDYPGVPLYVTENGAAFVDKLEDGVVHDAGRVAYLRSYLGALSRAIADGAPVRGYFVWSLMDNYEWAFGYSQRFGITYIDYDDDLRRIVKDSGHLIAHIAKDNQIPA